MNDGRVRVTVDLEPLSCYARKRKLRGAIAGGTYADVFSQTVILQSEARWRGIVGTETSMGPLS